jgi:hypothetical protein
MRHGRGASDCGVDWQTLEFAKGRLGIVDGHLTSPRRLVEAGARLGPHERWSNKLLAGEGPGTA